MRCLALCGHCGWPRRWFVWICVLLAARVGEATHPGPNWTLGVANLNGLNTRAFTLAESTVDSWLFSETHLTAPGEKAFRANLREAKAPYTSFVGGSPVPARSEVSDIGQWSGVGVLSQYPVRRLSHKWPEVVYRSGRLVCVSICCQGIWVSGVVVYGTPTGHTHVNGREVTNELLSLAIARVNLLNGPCFVAGDFNHDLDRLPAASVLSRLQFEECQDVHARLTGILPQATCRGKTRRDFLFMSRELCALFDRCEVDDNTVSDHAALICHFHGGRDLLRYSWPLPDQIEWEPTESRRPVSGPLFCPGSDVTVDYRRFWVQAEANNNEARRRNRKPEIRAMNGRATVLEPQVRTMQVPPLKASRPGDRQPLFLGSCLQHVQWTKQLRRLQSFVRLARAPVQTSAHCAHVHSLWSAIRSARGFVPSFGEWWSSRELGIGEPLTVPIQPPVAAQAALFYLGLELEVDSLEKALMRSRSHAKRLLKASDAQAMYAAVRRDAPAQVDSLVATVSGVVGCVDEAECALELTCPTEFNEQQPLVSEAGLHQIIHAEADKVWVDSCNGVAVGQAVWQKSQLGQLEDLFSAFESQWARLWNRHESVPSSQWQDILDFASAHLRPVTALPPEVTVQSLRRCAQRKSKHAAIGLDGVSRKDVLSLHDADLATLLKIYGHACTHGAWPEQILHGYVRSLAKIPEPETVGHYRPITVFSFLYRAWSSIAAKHWLRQVSQLVDPFLFGSTTGGRAAMVWRHVLETVEAAHRGDRPACGFTADIVKAFNDLPRLPAITAAKLFGVDQGTLLAWSGALSGFQRHFVIQGSYSPGVGSCNGFPEGCALSCLAMVSLTHLFHVWVRAVDMTFKPISYVDNCAVLLESPEAMSKACDAVDKFADMLQIKLDAKKCFTWSADRQGRAALRAQGFRVINATRDLGAHVVYTRQLSNGTLLDRIHGLDDFWTKLGSVSIAYKQKVLLVTRVAWPRALHAVSAAVVGKKRFEALRTAVMQSLGQQKPGANPDVQCCLEGLSFDPQAYAILETIRDARSMGSHSLVTLDLQQGPLSAESPTFNSLSEILCQRLHQAGFHVLPCGQAEDALGKFSFLDCAFGELVARFQQSWIMVVASKIAHRPTFQGFAQVDVVATRSDYRAFDGFDQGVLRKFLHGALITNDHVQHWSETGVACCSQCGGLDSVVHRLWECPSSGSLRSQLPDEFHQILPTLPAVVAQHGWTLQSSLWVPWMRYLSELPASFPVPQLPPPENILDLFTDGSCLFPRDPWCRVAAFSVVHASRFCLDFSPNGFRPLIAQPLAGVLQSAYRAELQAIVAALTIVAKFGVWVRIWSDSASAISAFHRHVSDGVPVNLNSKHSDLLREMQRLALEIGSEKIAILKVPAHQKKSDYTSELDHWLLAGNAAADAAAGAANQARGPAFWNLWEAHSRQVTDNQWIAKLVRRHIVAVSRLWSTSSSGRSTVPAAHPSPKPACNVPKLEWEASDDLALQGATFCRYFGSELAEAVRQWFFSIPCPDSPLRWISFLHLFITFQWLVGPISVAKRNGTWEVAKGEAARLLNHVKLSVRTKWFRLMIQQFLRDARVCFVTCTTRPFSQWVCCHRGALGFQIRDDIFQRVESFLQQQLGSPATGSGKLLERVHGI